MYGLPPDVASAGRVEPRSATKRDEHREERAVATA